MGEINLVKAVNKLMKVVEFVVTALLAAAVVIVILQIFWRYVLSNPLGWTDQMARFMFMWIIMLGIPVMFNRNIMMSFDMILENIHGKPHDIIHIVIRLLGVAFCVCYFLFALKLCQMSAGKTFPGVKIPYNFLYAAQPSCCVLLAIVLLKQAYEFVMHMLGKEVKD